MEVEGSCRGRYGRSRASRTGRVRVDAARSPRLRWVPLPPSVVPPDVLAPPAPAPAPAPALAPALALALALGLVLVLVLRAVGCGVTGTRGTARGGTVSTYRTSPRLRCRRGLTKEAKGRPSGALWYTCISRAMRRCTAVGVVRAHW